MQLTNILAVFITDVENSDNIDFSYVCRHYIGRWAEILSMVFSLISLLGGAVVYWVLMSNFLFHTVTFIHGVFQCFIFSARCNIYISRLCYDVSGCLSVRLYVTEVHSHIIANLGFKF